MEVRNLTAGAEVFTANAYYVTGERPTLVDVGTVPGIEEHIEDLDAVVLTHQHGDHIGELDAVMDAFDPALYCYAAHERRTHELEPEDTLLVGDEEFEIIFSPGHAADHIALASETTLFSGDVVVYNDGAFDDGSFGRTDRPGQSRERLIHSLEDILELMDPGVEHMYPGHGDSYHGDVGAVIERALERARRREPKYPT